MTGTGQLYVQGDTYCGRWRDVSGTRRNRKVGPARKPGSRDGLTKTQAEKRLQQMIDAEATVRAQMRVRIEQAGAALVQKLKAKAASAPSVFELGRRRKWCANNPVAFADGPERDTHLAPSYLASTAPTCPRRR